MMNLEIQKNEDIKIIEYRNEYRNKVIQFLIDVAIKEFGFEEWKNYFLEAKFLEMNKDLENFWIALDLYGNVIGTIGLSTSREIDVGKMHSLYLKKEYRKKGIATILYNNLIEFAKNSNYKTVILHTYTKFSEAIKFYQRKGFKVSQDIQTKDGIWYTKNIKTDTYIWNDYFLNIRNKYNMRVSTKKPLIINLDGKGVTKNYFFSLMDNKTKGSFLDIMKKTVAHFTSKYNCISIFGTDEVSFIFEEPMILVQDLNSKMNMKSDEIISMFSQYFFNYFNKLNSKEEVFWHGECFSIPQAKINSYIKYKSVSIKNVLTTYFLKKNNITNAGKINMKDKLEKLKEYPYYESELKEIENGLLYYCGDRIDIEEFLKGNVKKIEEKESRIRN